MNSVVSSRGGDDVVAVILARKIRSVSGYSGNAPFAVCTRSPLLLPENRLTA